MARTTNQIETALVSSINAVDPDIDAEKGPINDTCVVPQAQVLRDAELITDDLALRYSLQYVRTNRPDIIALYAYNHGLRRGEGKPSRTYILFIFTALPTTDFYAPQGTVVKSRDGTISFQTTEDVFVEANAFPGYYNEAEGRYEVRAYVESIGVGQRYQISSGRLTQLDQDIDDVTSVEQPVASSPSIASESNIALGERQQTKFLGLALGTPAGVESVIRDYNTTDILDVTVVFSTDIDLFKRPVSSPSFDIYIVGYDTQEQNDQFLGDGVTQEYVLSRQPVSYINAVTIDGVTVTASLVKDDTTATSRSVRAQDKVVLPYVPAANATISVSYTYDYLLNDVSNFITSSNRNLWRTDMLLRQGKAVGVDIAIEIQAMASFDTSRIESLTEAAVSNYINRNKMGLIYYPTDMRLSINGVVAGMSSIAVTKFQRIDQQGVLDVDVIETLRNEYLAVNNLSITVLA